MVTAYASSVTYRISSLSPYSWREGVWLILCLSLLNFSFLVLFSFRFSLSFLIKLKRILEIAIPQKPLPVFGCHICQYQLPHIRSLLHPAGTT